MIGSNFVLFRSLNLGGCFIPEVGVDMGYSILLNSAVLYAAYFVRWGSLISEYAFIAIPLHELQQFLIVRSAVIVFFVQVSMSWCTEGLALMGKQLPQTSRWGLITVIASKIYDWNGNIVKSNVSPQVLAWMGRIPLKEEMTESSYMADWMENHIPTYRYTDMCSKCVQICFCYYMWNIDSSVSLFTDLMSWKYYLWARYIRNILLLLKNNGLGWSPCCLNLISESSHVSLCVTMGIIAEVSSKYLAWRFLTPYSLHLSGKWVRWCPYLASKSFNDMDQDMLMWIPFLWLLLELCIDSCWIIAGALVLWAVWQDSFLSWSLPQHKRPGTTIYQSTRLSQWLD